MFCIIRVKSDPAYRRWAVHEAISVEAAYNAINHARVLGSIGSKDIRDSTYVGGGVTVIADVHELNSDNTLRQPYTQAY